MFLQAYISHNREEKLLVVLARQQRKDQQVQISGMLNKRLQTDSESHVSPLVCIDHEERSNEMGLLTVKVKQRLLIVCFLFFIVLVGALSSAVQLIVESEFVLWNWFVLLFCFDSLHV